MKIIGIKESSGTFQGRAYHHFKIYVSTSITKSGVGVECETLKVPTPVFDSFIKVASPSGDMSKLINLNINPSYDKFGHITKIYVEN